MIERKAGSPLWAYRGAKHAHDPFYQTLARLADQGQKGL